MKLFSFSFTVPEADSSSIVKLISLHSALFKPGLVLLFVHLLFVQLNYCMVYIRFIPLVIMLAISFPSLDLSCI